MQRLVSSRKNDEKEITHVRNAKGEVVLRTIIREVSKQYKVKPRDLMTTQRGKANLPRNVALYLACELTGLGQSQIAIHFGASSYRSVATQHFRVKEQMQSDKRLKKLIAKIKSTCS